jgi:hypothetical protein
MTSKPHGTVNNVPGTYTPGSPVCPLIHGGVMIQRRTEPA